MSILPIPHPPGNGTPSACVHKRHERTERDERYESTKRPERNERIDSLKAISRYSSSSSGQTKPVEWATRNQERAIFRIVRKLKREGRKVLPDAEEMALYWKSSDATASMEFLQFTFGMAHGWKHMKTPAGQGKLAEAVADSASVSLAGIPAAAYLNHMEQGLLRLCITLQDIAGPGNEFFLTSKALEVELRIGYKTISRWLLGLEGLGLIKRTFVGKSGQASRYVMTKQ